MTKSERDTARTLHHRQVQGEVLTDAEKNQVQEFLHDVSEEDAARRASAAHQQDILLAAKAERNRKLAELLQRQQQVARSLREALLQAEAERREIARERQLIESTPL